MAEPELQWRKPMQCVGHIVGWQPSATAHSEAAEVIVGGYSFCSRCGDYALGRVISENKTMREILCEFVDGVYEVTV